MSHTFEIYKDRAGEYRVRFNYDNESMFVTGGYSSKVSALNAIDSIKRNGPGALVVGEDVSEPSVMQKLLSAEPPSADELVRFERKAEAFKEFEQAYNAFKKEMSQANNLEFLSDDELELARSELSTFGNLKNRTLVRIRTLWQHAVNAFLWIAEKAGEAMIGTLAVAMLVALANLIGITL